MGFYQKRFFDEDQISTLKNKFCKIVEGKYETGIQPEIKYSKLADGLIISIRFVMDGSLMCGLKNFSRSRLPDMFLAYVMEDC